MPLSKVGLNVSALGNITTPEYNLPTTVSGWFAELPRKTNELTGGYFGGIILTTLFGYLFWILADKSQYIDFGYSKLRSAAIASGICSVIGIVMLNIGYFTNLYHVVVFIVVFIITTIWVAKNEK